VKTKKRKKKKKKKQHDVGPKLEFECLFKFSLDIYFRVVLGLNQCYVTTIFSLFSSNGLQSYLHPKPKPPCSYPCLGKDLISYLYIKISILKIFPNII
jgi:hypothetical protein